MADLDLIDVRALGRALDVDGDELCTSVLAFEAGPHAQQLLRQLANAESKVDFSTAYSQCCSAEFVDAHPAEEMGSDELFVPVEPKFWVVFACVRSAVAGHAALPNHTLGHPMLRLGPAALPTFVSALIQQQSETPSAAMGCLLEHRGEVASWFAVHGALLATIKLSDLRVALFAASGNNKAIKGGLNALAARLVGKAHSRSASNTSTWLPLATKIRASLPTQLPDATPSPTKITAAHAVPVLEVKAPCDGAPDKVQVHVELSTSTPEVDVPPPFNPHYCDSDDEEQQNAGVHWLLLSAASEGAEAATIKTNCHGTSLNLVAVRNNDRTAGNKAACKWLQDLLHPHTANMQIKPDFVRWLRCATDPSIRLPTMAGESKPGYVDTDGRAVYQLAAYLMYLVRMFRLVDRTPWSWADCGTASTCSTSPWRSAQLRRAIGATC